MIGLGMFEAISEEDILDWADPMTETRTAFRGAETG